jgi:hypothetical protein
MILGFFHGQIGWMKGALYSKLLIANWFSFDDLFLGGRA